MTTLTRCPECLTAFRISTHQLASRHGKVRCGQCNAVFNALECLLETAPPAPASGHEAEAGSSNFDLFGASTAHGALDSDPIGVAPALPQSSLLALGTPTRRRFPWLSGIGAGLALVGLLAQAVWFYRDQIATHYPKMKPYLEAACVEIGCRIEPPIDPQAISIESSDLQADPGNRAMLVLSAVLRNHAGFNQSLPLLELSLTDAQDLAVARRVLKPAEYLQDTGVTTIAAGGELQLRVHVDAGALKANGYRLYAFYP